MPLRVAIMNCKKNNFLRVAWWLTFLVFGFVHCSLTAAVFFSHSYDKRVIDYMARPGGIMDWWGQKYLSANIVFSDNTPFGNQYRLLKGPTSTVLTFGFLYNMKGNDGAVTVKDVNQVVQEGWFSDALRKPGYDAILILAHMGHEDALLSVILSKIRSIVGNGMPVQFITGHTHIRAVQNPDSASFSFEAGRYLDTVGFVSFPRKDTLTTAPASTNRSDLFQHVFLDASRARLEQTLNGPALATTEGAELSAFIHRIQVELGLREIVGCAPHRYYFSKPIFESDSVWGLFEREVVPQIFGEQDIVMFHTEMARYDLLPGDITLDEVIGMSPFNDTLYIIPDVPLDILVELNRTINDPGKSYYPGLLPYTFASTRPLPQMTFSPGENGTSSTPVYNLISCKFGIADIVTQLQLLYPEAPQAAPLPTGSLDIWLRFFERDHLCETIDKGSHRPSPHPHHNGTIPTFGFENRTDEEKDQIRMAFAGVALGIVALLGAVYIRKRGSIFREVTHAKEMVILAAQREFDGVEDEFDELDNELL